MHVHVPVFQFNVLLVCFQSQSYSKMFRFVSEAAVHVISSLKIQYPPRNVVGLNFKSLRHAETFSDGVPVYSSAASPRFRFAASRLRCDIISNRVRRTCGNSAPTAACRSETLLENNTPSFTEAAGACFVLVFLADANSCSFAARPNGGG